jgi:lysophospholipase L1-like esterase
MTRVSMNASVRSVGIVLVALGACQTRAVEQGASALSLSGQRSAALDHESAIKCIAWGADRLDLFARNAAGDLLTKSWISNAWSPSQTDWTGLGGPIEGGPEVVSWGPGRLDVFARFGDGKLYTKSLTGSTWSPSPLGWTSLDAPAGTSVIGHPSAESWSSEHIHVMVAASDGHDYLKALTWNAGTMSQATWVDMGGPMSGSPKLVSWAPDRLHLMTRGIDGQLYIKAWTGSGWVPSQLDWITLGAPANASIAADPVAVSWAADRLHILVNATDGNAYLKAWDGTGWVPSQTGWVNLGACVGTPEVVSWGPDRLDFFARQMDGSVGIKSWVGNGWVPSVTGWNSLGLPTSGFFNAPITAVSWAANRLHIFSPSSQGIVEAKAWDGTNWIPGRYTWADLGGAVAGDPTAMLPFWSGSVMEDESVLMVSPSPGESPQASLLWTASQVLSVRDPTGEIQYKQGVDWDYDGASNVLRLLPGSHAPSMMQTDLYPQSPSAQTKSRVGGGYILFHEDSFFHNKQLMVSYSHAVGLWTGPTPSVATTNLPRTLAKLGARTALRVTLYGDSISEGFNASGFPETAAPPFQPSWGDLVVRQVQSFYGASVILSNTAYRGTSSVWAMNGDNVQHRVIDTSPDLVILAFGMNDGSEHRSAAEFASNIASVISTVRASLPNVEFILVAPTVPNPEAADFIGTQRDYGPVLGAMVGAGVAFVDMTTTHDALLARKRYRDMAGNNVNHPNDFLIRWYAQMVTGLLVPPP